MSHMNFFMPPKQQQLHNHTCMQYIYIYRHLSIYAVPFVPAILLSPIGVSNTFGLFTLQPGVDYFSLSMPLFFLLDLVCFGDRALTLSPLSPLYIHTRAPQW